MKKTFGPIRRVMTMLLCFVLAGMIAYLGVIGMLVWKVNNVPQMDHYDAIVVLGAQVKADGSLSLQLEWRLEAAFEAWEKQNCLIVTCGAQGSNEPAPEAYVMRDYLMQKGVPEDMILTDAESFNTRQNLEMQETLESTGIPVAYFDVFDFDDYLRLLKLCTQITGCEENYERYGTQVQKQVEAVIAQSKVRL